MRLSSSTCLLLSAALWMDLARDYVRLALIDTACRIKWLAAARRDAAHARRLATIWRNNSILAA